MDDRGDEIDRAMARLLARLEADRLGPALAWAATRSDAELAWCGMELSADDRLELVAWALALSRRHRP